MNKIIKTTIVSAILAAFAAGTAFAREADFPSEPPTKINVKAVKNADFVLAAAFDTPILPDKEEPTDIEIMGAGEATEEQMAEYIKKRNKNPKLNCTVKDIVRYYYIEAGREGIRPDIALCQALKETGVFGYGGDVSPKQNNFCGLGATGNKEPGASFATPQLGVRAHIQHLMVYTTKRRPSLEVIDPRYELVKQKHPEIYGNITKWTGLNGVWAVPGTTYGQDILKLWRQAKAPTGSDASLAAARKAVENAPDDADALTYRAMVYINRNQKFSARADLDAAINLAPNAELYYDRALITDTAKKRQKAIQDYNEAIKLNPGFTEAYYNRGILYFEEKKYNEAKKDFEKALELDPRFANAKNNIAMVYLKRKKYKDAWRTLYEAGEINTTNENIIKNKKIFVKCLKPAK